MTHELRVALSSYLRSTRDFDGLLETVAEIAMSIGSDYRDPVFMRASMDLEDVREKWREEEERQDEEAQRGR